MVPSSNWPSAMYFLASSTVISSNCCSSLVPKFKQTLSTPVKITNISASTMSANLPAAKSFSITALAPLRLLSCASTGIPPPPQAITI